MVIWHYTKFYIFWARDSKYHNGVMLIKIFFISGMSGIFKGNDYLQGLWECVPYNPGSLRSVYHVRSLDVFRLSQLSEKVHVMLSHDWPRGITNYGDVDNLLRRKVFLRYLCHFDRFFTFPCNNININIMHNFVP